MAVLVLLNQLQFELTDCFVLFYFMVIIYYK